MGSPHTTLTRKFQCFSFGEELFGGGFGSSFRAKQGNALEFDLHAHFDDAVGRQAEEGSSRLGIAGHE